MAILTSTKYAKLIGVLAGLALAVTVLISVLPGSGRKQALSPQSAYGNLKNTSVISPVSSAEYRILHVMSYHMPWKWTDDQLEGFQDALSNLNVQYKIVQMDTKRKSDEIWRGQITAQTKDLIESWKPDLVFTGDDNAQQYVSADYVNSDIPFVFCAVNADPESMVLPVRPMSPAFWSGCTMLQPCGC